MRDDLHHGTSSICAQTDDYGMANGYKWKETDSIRIQTDDQIVEDELQHSTEPACHRKTWRKSNSWKCASFNDTVIVRNYRPL